MSPVFEKANALVKVAFGAKGQVLPPGWVVFRRGTRPVMPGPAKHRIGHVFGFDFLRVGPPCELALVNSGCVGQKNAQAKMNHGQVGQNFVVEDIGIDAVFPHQAGMASSWAIVPTRAMVLPKPERSMVMISPISVIW